MALFPTDLRTRLWHQPAAAIAALVLCVSLVAGMAWAVLDEIEKLSSSNSDNMQWSLAQADVEFLRFRLALWQAYDVADHGLPGEDINDLLGTMRDRFDIFYARMNTISGAAAFRALRANPDFDGPRQRVADFMADTAAVIDQPDDQVIPALEGLLDPALAAGQDVRDFSLAALDAFAQLADARQGSLIRKLGMIATVLFLFIAGLSLLALILMRLARQAKSSALEAQDRAARMRTIVETSLDAIVVTDQDGRIRDFNGAAERIFGYPRKEAVGRMVRDLLIPESEAHDLRQMADSVLEARARGDRILHPFEIIAKDRFGRRFPAEISFDRAADDANLFVSFIRDISLRKAQEEMLTQARDRALAGERSKSEFLAVMSHEMRTPLNGLLGSMQLLRDHDLSPTQSELLKLMQSSAQLLLNLVNDVLDLAKFESGKMRAETGPFAVSTLLGEVVETTSTQAAKNGNKLDWYWVGTPQEELTSDSRRLRQVLLNLVTNAIKFTRNGNIDIEVELTGPERNQLELRVIDTGLGIEESDIDRIFNDFETLDSSYARQAGGTGLGLGISRRLTELMGGTIGCESVPGEGSLFWIRIPVTRPSTGKTQPPMPLPDLSALPLRPLDVLLVEDNEINRFIARKMLETEGHRVTEAEDGQLGVAAATARHYDLILMDISMPVMDGTEAACAIRAGHGPSFETPIVALTAHALPEELQRFRSAGMNHVLSKPIDRQVLRAFLADLAAGRLPEQEAAPAIVAPDPALIDVSQIRNLFEGTGPETGHKLLERFSAETDGTVAALVACPSSKAEIARLAHACAGTCGTFGLIAMRRALAALETKAKRNLDIPAEELEALDPLWRDSRAQLDALDKLVLA